MLDLAVVESRWWEKGNASVRGLFELIATIRKENPHAYHYEMFNNQDSLREVVCRIARRQHVRNLVIAAHGDDTAIYGAASERECDNRISRAVLRNIFADIPRGSLNGLYLGTCSTTNLDTVKFLLKESRVRWVAGYSKEVAWLESGAVDLYFWTTYYRCRRMQDNHDPERRRMERVAKKMMRIKGLCDSLGFDIFVRRLGPGGGVQSLM